METHNVGPVIIREQLAARGIDDDKREYISVKMHNQMYLEPGMPC